MAQNPDSTISSNIDSQAVNNSNDSTNNQETNDNNNAKNNSNNEGFMSRVGQSFSKLGTKLNISKKEEQKQAADGQAQAQAPPPKDPSRLSMEGLLKQARIVFERWLNAQSPFKRRAPHGIVFLSTVKGAFGFGGEVGTGVAFYRLPKYLVDQQKKEEKKQQEIREEKQKEIEKNKQKEEQIQSQNPNEEGEQEQVVQEQVVQEDKPHADNDAKNNDDASNNVRNEDIDDALEWSGPCAIGSGALSWGFQIGVSKVDTVIILPSKHHAITFMSKAQVKLGGNAGLTVVNVGANASGSLNISNKDFTDIHSFTLDSKGLAIGVSVEGAVISIRHDCNKKFYGRDVTVEDIGYNRINKLKDMPQNNDYDRIIQLLNQHFTLRRPFGPGPGPRGPPHGPAVAPIIAPVVVGAALRPHRHGPHRGPFRGPHRGPLGRPHRR